MDKDKIWQHITRNLADEENAEDKIIVDTWLNKNNLNPKIYHRLKEIWDYNPTQINLMPQIYQKLLQRIKSFQTQHNPYIIINRILRIAALVILALLSGYLINQFTDFSKQTEIVYNEISVPKGNRSAIFLPDSTKVWISNDTKIKYPVDFTGENRVVDLAGEAYFEVHHNRDYPFLVKIGKHRIRVMGTKFSVSAYPEDDFIKTSLVKGQVQFDISRKNAPDKYISYSLKPGFSLTYNKNERNLTETKITTNFCNYWMNGVYEFKSEKLESLAKIIYRIYNITIVFEDDCLKNKTYTGALSIDDNIFTFIEAVKRTAVEPIEYSYDKNKIYIKLKN